MNSLFSKKELFLRNIFGQPKFKSLNFVSYTFTPLFSILKSISNLDLEGLNILEYNDVLEGHYAN